MVGLLLHWEQKVEKVVTSVCEAVGLAALESSKLRRLSWDQIVDGF
jgi:hypothetical protein